MSLLEVENLSHAFEDGNDISIKIISDYIKNK